MSPNTPKPSIILYDYPFAPHAQRVRNFLNTLNLPYRSCTQPFFIPRQDLLDLGITYRRVPVCILGKDVYCDGRGFVDALLEVYADEASAAFNAAQNSSKKLVRAADEKAWETFGYRTFWLCLPLVPPNLNDAKLQNDRSSLFSIFSHPDYAALRPSALAEFRAMLDVIENEFLGDGRRFVKGGDKVGIEDLHAMWMVKWALQTMGVDQEPGFGKKDWPRVYRWIESVVKNEGEDPDSVKIGKEEAQRTVLGAEYAVGSIGVDGSDPTGFKEGQRVSVGCSDE